MTPSTRLQEAGDASGAWKPSALERLACAALEALELGAGAPSSTGAAAGAEGGAEAARKLLCAPASAQLHARAQCLLRAVHHTHYHQYKVLNTVNCLNLERLARVFYVTLGIPSHASHSHCSHF